MAQMNVEDIKISKIKLGKNCRLNIGDEDLAGLMQAIKAQGLLQPVGVTPMAGGAYELAYGNRRFLACSKLGWTTIPAVVQEVNGEYSRDLKNLTENVQRKHISLIEIGRFVELLKAQNLTVGEIAIRMGVTESHLRSAILAYEDVPKEYRGDIEMTHGNSKVAPGKISITATRSIMNAQKSYNLSTADTKALFKAAKENKKFNNASVEKYAAAIKHGHKKDFITKVKPVTAIRLYFFVDSKEADRLREKHIENGPFKSMTALAMAILKGEKSERIKIL